METKKPKRIIEIVVTPKGEIQSPWWTTEISEMFEDAEDKDKEKENSTLVNKKLTMSHFCG